MLAPDSFDEFFAAIHAGQRPFAWQRRLLDTLVEGGRWPDRIVAPTGAGKTAVIDVHVFAVALMAAGTGGRVPRRLSLIVDRRALVDSQHDLAWMINARLRSAEPGSLLAVVRDLLLSLRSGREAPDRPADPLMVVMLRGGVDPSRRWVDDPTAPAIICATPAMWGSRLLFRGYGSSPHARPREAGLLAYDSVAVIDEAHLARQLVATARRVSALEAMATSPIPVDHLQVVETTATSDESGGGGTEIALTRDDLEPEEAGAAELARRMLTPKPVRLISADWPASSIQTRAALARCIAYEVDDLREAYGPTVGCVLNTVGLAVMVAAELRKRGRQVELLVGRLRPHDVARLRARRPRLLSLAGEPDVDALVATQTIEVGVDADFSAMVTELASGSALAQRAGRVNRVGRRGATEVRVVVPSGQIPPNGAPPYRPDELGTALAWAARRVSETSGLAPLAVAIDPPPPGDLRRIVLARPEPWHALYLAQTSDELFAEPDLALLLADDLDPDTDLALVVRRRVSDDPTIELAMQRATPPRPAECFPVSLTTLRSLLDERPVPGFRWRGDELDVLRRNDLRPGDIVVVGEDAPWFNQGVVDREGAESQVDVLEDGLDGEPLVLRIGPGMPIDDATDGRASAWLLDDVREILDAHPEDGRARRERLASALTERVARLGLSLTKPPGSRLLAAAGLLGRRLADASIALGPPDQDGRPTWVVIADQRRRLTDEEVRQTWSPSTDPVPLPDHQAAVASRAHEIAERLGLGATLADALRAAGALHDEGKRDARFQRLLGSPTPVAAEPPSVLAKSGRRTPSEYVAARTAADLPNGWRHEQLSAAVAWQQAAQDASGTSDLTTRLVGTSHGRGRVTFPHTAGQLLTGDPALSAAQALFDHGVWDEILESTHRAYGVWGCAFLEALLRAADGQVSGEGG